MMTEKISRVFKDSRAA